MTDEAFEQAVRDYANTIFRVAYHAVKDRQEAEDVTQNGFIAALSVCRRVSERRTFEALAPSGGGK